jgi:CRISPR-associated protein Csb2
MPTNLLPRNYKPSEEEKKAGRFQGDPTMVFDTFVVVNRHDSLHVGWPNVTLPENGRDLLAELVRNLSSLGRAEGWVACELTDETVAWNCEPSALARSGELVTVLCANPETAFGDEHYPPRPDAKKRKSGIPPGERLFDCPRWHLCLDTEIIHEKRWPNVPGSMWVSYCRQEPTPEPRPTCRQRPANATTVARFSLDGPVLPLVTETISVAEQVRKALLHWFPRVVRHRLPSLPPDATHETHPELRSPTFSGKQADEMITGSHDHAYFLPADEDDDGRIDHVTVFASIGFTRDELAALDRLRQLKFGDTELRLLLVGLGRPEDFRCRLFGPAQVWESATPFVVTRHVKERGQKKDPPDCQGIEGRPVFARLVLGEDLSRWIGRQPNPIEPPQVETLEAICTGKGRRARVLEFRRARQGRRGDDGFRRATGAYRLTFQEPVSGPICIGHAAHYGLGLFVARES